MRNENINWDTDTVHSAWPCRALWAVTFHVWAAPLTSSPDTSMYHGRAAGGLVRAKVLCVLKPDNSCGHFYWKTHNSVLELHLKVEGGSLSSGPHSFSVFLQLQRWTGGMKAAKQPRGQLITNSCGGRTTGHSLADCWTILRLFYVFYVISWLTLCWFLTLKIFNQQ